MAALESEERIALAARLAEELAPGLLAQGITVVVVLADERGWAYSAHGKTEHARLGLRDAAENANSDEGWRAVEGPARA